RPIDVPVLDPLHLRPRRAARHRAEGLADHRVRHGEEIDLGTGRHGLEQGLRFGIERHRGAPAVGRRRARAAGEGFARIRTLALRGAARTSAARREASDAGPAGSAVPVAGGGYAVADRGASGSRGRSVGPTGRDPIMTAARRRSPYLRLGVLSVLLLSLAACRTYNVHSDWDDAASFEGFQRYAWLEPRAAEGA